VLECVQEGPLTFTNALANLGRLASLLERRAG